MEFILAKRQDAEQVYEIVQETIKEVYPKYYLKEIVDALFKFHNYDNIVKDIEAENTYLLKDNEEIIGTGTKKENHITRVYVLPKYQKKGYGTYIMKQLEEIISEQYNYADIDASLPACRLYAHLGYQTVDHGIWECENGIIQVYEIMKKQLVNKSLPNLVLRPYKQEDAEAIVSWIKDETALRKWSSDRYGAYPIRAEDINYKYLKCNGDCEEFDNFYPMTAVDENGPVGHLILRYTNKEKTIIRLGFIIVDDSKRGMGYGKRMIQMAMQYAFEMLKAEKITLGVFDNNPSAYYCYKAAGFNEIHLKEDIVFEIFGEKWKCIEMEANDEEGRLASKHGQVEFRTTMKYIHEIIGDTEKKKILEVGAGTGRYSIALAKEGHEVDALEYTAHNLEIMNSKIEGITNIRTCKGTALDLSRFADETFDITLVLGPMYHMYTKEDKQKVLEEAIRVTKKHGHILVAYCMNEATMIQFTFKAGKIWDCINNQMVTDDFRCISEDKDLFEMVRLEEIDELNACFENVKRIKIIAADGATNYMREYVDDMDEATFDVWMKYHFSICERMDLIGATNHSLDILEKIN